MKPYFLSFLLMVLSSYSSFSQSIENIRTTADNERVIIEYDLVSSNLTPVYIIVVVKLNNSKIIHPTQISGDLNSLKSGKNKIIIWEALKEIGEIDGELSVELSIQSKKYNEAKIGTQVWMTENLNVEKFRNGDLIPEAKTEKEWIYAVKNKHPVWCYYDNNPVNGETYGRLYNWYAVNDPRGLAPEAWHIPSDEEWKVLIGYLGGEAVAGEMMKNSIGWDRSGNGSNRSGFSALPGGRRFSGNGMFYGIELDGYWWSSKEDIKNLAFFRSLDCHFDRIYRRSWDKGDGFSIRCLKD